MNIEVYTEIVGMADLGLLLGCPVLNNALERIAQILTEHLAKVPPSTKIGDPGILARTGPSF